MTDAVGLCMRYPPGHIPTTLDFLEEVRALISKERADGKPVSDYAVAKRLGWKSGRFYNYTSGNSTFDDGACAVIAQTLDYPLETVLACVYLERSKKQDQNDTVTQAWQRICQHVAMSLVCFCVGFSSVFILPL